MRVRMACLALILMASAAAISAAAARATTAVPIRESLHDFPMTLGEWRGRAGVPFEQKILDVLGVDDYANLSYTSSSVAFNRPVGLYIGYWGSQARGDTIHSPLNCLPGAGWEPVSNGELAVNAGGRDLLVNRYVIRKGLDRYLVLYWYQSHGRVVADEYTSRAYMVWDALRDHRTDAALIRVLVPIGDAEATDIDAEHTAIAFVQSMFPRLGDYLPS